jgi:hypothetical protein
MRELLRAAVMSLVATNALAGTIDFASPAIVSGEITMFDDHHLASEQELSPDQLRSLIHWLTWNQHGWFSTEEKAPREPVQLQINLRHSDGTLAMLSVVPVTRPGKRDLFFINKGASWSYHAWLGQYKAPAATRPLSEYDLDFLQKLLHK